MRPLNFGQLVYMQNLLVGSGNDWLQGMTHLADSGLLGECHECDPPLNHFHSSWHFGNYIALHRWLNSSDTEADDHNARSPK